MKNKTIRAKLTWRPGATASVPRNLAKQCTTYTTAW